MTSDRTQQPTSPQAGDRADALPEALIDEALRALGSTRLEPPPLGASLEAELQHLAPVTPRRPYRQFLATCALSLLYGGLLLLYLRLRRDLGGLPLPWLIAYCAAWLASFLGITWLALVPGPGRVMPNGRHAGMGAGMAAVGFIAAGLLFARHVPGLSVMFEPSLQSLVHHSSKCLMWGVLTALVPVVLSALLLRGALPVGSRWAGAGLGAAGGSLGGLVLHLHCPVADALHLGVVHGGVVLAGAVLGALMIPPATHA